MHLRSLSSTTLTDYQAHNLFQQRLTAEGRERDYDILIKTLSQQPAPRIHAVLRRLHDEGASPRQMTRKILDLFAGVYRSTKGFLRDELSFTMLGYCLGGRPMVHALHKYLGLPSLRTADRKELRTDVKACLRNPDEETMLKNIKTVIIPQIDAENPPQVLNHIALDETALTPCAFYNQDCNAIGGICPCNSQAIDLTLSSYSTLSQVRHLLYPSDGSAPTIHFANQATLGAVVIYSAKHHYARPFLCAGTCQSKDAEGFVSLVDMLYRVYDNSGLTARIGRFSSIATDGDSARRKGGYRILMSQMLDSMSPLGQKISPLIGMNQLTGRDNVTLDFDYKHIFKRFGTCIRSTAGMTVNGVIIKPGLIIFYLQRTGLAPHKIKSLFEPFDAQNVMVCTSSGVTATDNWFLGYNVTCVSRQSCSAACSIHPLPMSFPPLRLQTRPASTRYTADRCQPMLW
jgi:hypothetical protein